MNMTFEQLSLFRFRLSLALSTCWSYKISEYDQEIPQSQTTDKSMAPQGRATQQPPDTRKSN